MTTSRIESHSSSKVTIKDLGLMAFNCLIAILIATYFIPKQFQLTAAALITFSLRDKMLQYLNQNREAIWKHNISPYKANSTLTLQFVVLFAIIFITTFILYFFLSPTEGLFFEHRYQNLLSTLYFHNLQVLIGFFIFAAIYKSSGLMFILAWNALNWASSISGVFERFFNLGISKAVSFILSILPHLLFEAIAYILAGLAGVFLSKAIQKYRLSSTEFLRVSKASFTVLIFAIIALGLAVFSEFYLAQGVFKILR